MSSITTITPEHLAERTEGLGFQSVFPDGVKVHSKEEAAIHSIHVSLSRGGVSETFKILLFTVNVDESWADIAIDQSFWSVNTDGVASSEMTRVRVGVFWVVGSISSIRSMHLGRS